ncbi:MAG: hypothetical protein JW791_00435 [Nanoarchaeota archaeon]|nr:hypothetical protein [Nanoarchaeota archaeon]
MKNLIPVLLLIGLVLVAGCTQTSQQSSQDSVSLSDSDQVFDEFESSLLEESNDVELGSLI